MKDRLFKQFLICAAIFVVLTLMALFSSSVHIGFLGYLAMPVVGTFWTTVGVAGGDAFRRFVMPDVMFAADALEMFRKRVFWLWGPQVIGWIMGYMAFTGTMRNVLGIPV